MRLYVARAIGIGVVAPDATDVLGTFENEHVAASGSKEIVESGDAARTGADDNHVVHVR
jgi:hypothetical protein